MVIWLKMEDRKCDICGAIAVDVWIDPRFPESILWVCREDLYDLTELFNHVIVVDKQ